MRGKHGFRDALARGAIVIEHVLAECRAQLEWYRTKLGTMPTHIDGHHHVHVLPLLAEPLAALFRAHGQSSSSVVVLAAPAVLVVLTHAVCVLLACRCAIRPRPDRATAA